MGTRTGIMLCHPLEEKRLQRWNTSHVLCQPKLDGERCRAIVYPDRVDLISSEGNSFISVPHIEQALVDLRLVYAEFDGELYAPGLDFSQIHSIVSRTKGTHPDYEKIQYHVFDHVNGGPQTERIGVYMSLLEKADPNIIVPVETALCPAYPEQIMEIMESYVDEGQEGIIVRHPDGIYERKRSNWIMKFKPRKEDIYAIVDVVEEISKDGVPKNSLGALVLSDKEGTKFGCGSGFDASQRKIFWERRESLIGMYCLIKYQQLSTKKVPRFPIFAEIIDPIDYNYGNPITKGE